MNNQNNYLNEIRSLISKEVKAIKEISSLYQGFGNAGQQEKSMISSQISSLKTIVMKSMDEISSVLEDMSIIKPLPKTNIKLGVKKEAEQNGPIGFGVKKQEPIKQEASVLEEKKRLPLKYTTIPANKHLVMDDLEKKTIKRIKKKKVVKKVVKEKKPSKFVSFANKLFAKKAKEFDKSNFYLTLKKDLIKAHLEFTPSSYISIIFLSTLISIIVGIFIFLFFLLFNLSFQAPFISSVTTSFFDRFLQTFWIMFAVPIATFLIVYAYPSVEKAYIGSKINQELPFATIHMSAISGAMIEPSKIFKIMISTNEYPFLEKEFKKLLNEINVYGYDLVGALRSIGANSPSTKLTELLNGLATTINSGGDLQNYFDKKAQTLLFEYRLEREKYTKGAETFMDIYISLVIAAPMILMLLLMMMRVSGLGVSLSTSMITLVMVLGVGMINIIFLTFLQLRQPAG